LFHELLDFSFDRSNQKTKIYFLKKIMKINNDINSLSPTFRKKFDPRRKEVKEKYPHAHVFETRRSKERQKRLYEESDRREKK